MLRFEPRDEQSAPLELAGTEAQERVHLVDVAPHIADVLVEACDGRIGGICDQVALVVHNSPERIVKQGEAVACAVADCVAQEFAVGAWHVEGVRRVARGQRREQRRLIRVDERNIARRYSKRDATPRRLTEIGFVRVARHSHGVHRPTRREPAARVEAPASGANARHPAERSGASRPSR